MLTLAELSFASHGDLAVHQQAAARYASRQHLLNLRVSEVSAMVLDLPVFFSRNSQSGQWLLSSLCSFTPGQNLRVQQDRWLGGYQPLCLQTYPLVLVGETKAGSGPSKLGLWQDQAVLGLASAGGLALFQSSGQPSLYLKQQQVLLKADLEQEFQTYQFIKTISELGLLKELDLHLLQQDGGSQLIKGLATVNEDQLQQLSATQLFQLQQQGYLLVLHAMLLSIGQLNPLILWHNQQVNQQQVHQQQVAATQPAGALLKSIKLELSRSPHSAAF